MSAQQDVSTAAGPAPATQNERTVVMRPAVDIFENDKEYLIVSDMPGVEPEVLNIQFDTPNLTIEGRQPEGADSQNQGLPISFERSFRMPPSVAAEGIRAELRGGVLRLHLEKSEKAKPKKIEVKRG